MAAANEVLEDKKKKKKNKKKAKGIDAFLEDEKEAKAFQKEH